MRILPMRLLLCLLCSTGRISPIRADYIRSEFQIFALLPCSFPTLLHPFIYEAFYVVFRNIHVHKSLSYPDL
ncbi:hypothetical protein BGX38DRAFT_1197647 [Terfezia claveryi]|nr:hypothetical protein BGX38DRAFT_1197647 [Terfezia claveryi]